MNGLIRSSLNASFKIHCKSAKYFHSNGSLFSECPLGKSIYKSEHLSLMESLTKIIDKDINPFVDEWEEKGIFPAHEVFKKLGQAGFLGVNKPPEYGGLGLDYTFNLAINETLGKINAGGVAMGIAVQTDMATPSLARFGSEKLRKEFLAPSIAGDYVACVGVSESAAGSDVAGIQTKAAKVGGDLVINGNKMWITNSIQADWMCVLANTGEGHVHKNKSLICVPMKTPGIHIAKKIDKLGMRCSDTGLIYFEDVRVPQSYIIGEEGMGFTYQMLQFQEERLAGAAIALQPMIRSINTTIEYCKERHTFGKPVLHNQAIYFRLAELATEVEAYKALLYKTVELYADGNDVTKWASMCKLKGGRLTRIVSDACLQYWGGMGYTNDVQISRAFRDSRLMSLAGGSDEVMLMIISKYMNMLPSGKKGK